MEKLDKLINRLHRYSENCVAYKLDADFSDAVQTAANTIAKMEKFQWISVNERLPDVHDDAFDDGDEIISFTVSDPVLCVYNDNELIVAVYEIDDNKHFWVSTFDSCELNTVTHWMPLPDLPWEES